MSDLNGSPCREILQKITGADVEEDEQKHAITG